MSQRQTKRLSLCLPPLSPFSIFPLPGQCCSSLCSNFFFPNSCVPNIPPPHLPTLRILPPPSYWICLSFSFTFLFLWSLSILLSLLYFSLSLFHILLSMSLVLSSIFFSPSTVFCCTPLILSPTLFKERQGFVFVPYLPTQLLFSSYLL